MTDAPSPPADIARLLPLMLALAFTTGLVDAVSVLGLGKVFTANMTGNVVFLGLALAGAQGFVPSLYVTALAAFLSGAVAAGRIGRRGRELPIARWLTWSAGFEAVLLWAAALVAIEFGGAHEAAGLSLYTIIILTGIAMGFRNATIRQLHIPDVTTTVLTLTLTGLAADSSIAGGGNPNWGRRGASVAALFAGAGIGALLVLGPGLAPALLLAGAIVVIATLLCAWQRH